GVVLRLIFGSLFFWGAGLLSPKKYAKATPKDIVILLIVGMIFVYGYMWTLLEGLSYTTPISSSIFISLQPVFVYIYVYVSVPRRCHGAKSSVSSSVWAVRCCVCSPSIAVTWHQTR
ncbi:MAG: EamA family transporter, partial [Muribaculaceae bacterium]|nr:EamA family transporter [Muribaculaceae bacterium]